jgi:hypothetical protein
MAHGGPRTIGITTGRKRNYLDIQRARLTVRREEIMKVSLPVGDTSAILGNNGITLRVKTSNGSHRGDLRIAKGLVEWRPSKKSVTTHPIRWERFIKFMESDLTSYSRQ